MTAVIRDPLRAAFEARAAILAHDGPHYGYDAALAKADHDR